MDNTSSTAPTVVRKAFLALFILLTVAVGVRQNGSLERQILGWGVMALYFAMFLTKISLSWYMIVPIAIVAVSADWRLAAVTGVCSFGCLLINLRQGAFSRDFPAPDTVSVPRYVVYLVLPAMTLLLILIYNRRSRRLVHSGPKS